MPRVESSAVLEAARALDPECAGALAVFLAESEAVMAPAIVAALDGEGFQFFGGIFPGLVEGGETHESGAILVSLPARARPLLVRDLDGDRSILEALPRTAGEDDPPTLAFVLLDGLASGISGFLGALFSRFGDSVHYFGGGAGSLTDRDQPSILCNEGLFSNAAIVTFVALDCEVGVRHGWRRIMGPFVATRTEGNVIVELNWRNALEVYRSVVEPDVGRGIDPEDFFAVSKAYPFGMLKEGAEDVVRDPISVTDRGGLVCVGEVPENTVLSILKGEEDSLIASAAQAAKESLRPEGEPRMTLIADCISRASFLEQRFGLELDAVRNHLAAGTGNSPGMFGMLTLGEVASGGQGVVEFLNKTVVVGTLYEAT